MWEYFLRHQNKGKLLDLGFFSSSINILPVTIVIFWMFLVPNVLWFHHFRSQGGSWYGKIFSNIFALKDFVGVVDASTLSDYVKTDWKDYKEKILAKTK